MILSPGFRFLRPLSILAVLLFQSQMLAQPSIRTIAGGGGSGPNTTAVNAKNIGISMLVSDNAVNYAGFEFGDFGNSAILAADTHGNIYAAQAGRVYKINPSGSATPIAGNGSTGFSNGGTVALNATFGLVSGLAVDGNGNVFISDLINLCVWEVNPNVSGTLPGSIARVAGVPTLLNSGFTHLNAFLPEVTVAGATDFNQTDVLWTQSGDGDLAINAGLAPPSGLAVDGNGHLYILTALGIRKVDLNTGLISTVPLLGPLAQNLTYSLIIEAAAFASDSVPAGQAGMVARHPKRPRPLRGVPAAVQPQGLLPASGVVEDTVHLVGSLVIDPLAQNLYASDAATGYIYQIDLCTGNVTLLSFYLSAGGLAMDAQGDLFAATTEGVAELPANSENGSIVVPLTFASGILYSYPVTVDTMGHVYYGYQQQVWQAALPSGTPVVFAGDGSFDYNGDAAGTPASFAFPIGVAVDLSGNTYIADTFNNRVREISSSGAITTAVGTGVAGSSGSSGQGATFALNGPACLAVDSLGQNLYIDDTNNLRILQFNLSSGMVTTVAGGGATSPFSGGLATGAALSPNCIALDGQGNLYIANYEYDSNNIAKVVLSSNMISATSVSTDNLGSPTGSLFGMASDPSGNIYLSDATYHVVYKVSGGVATVFAGTYSTPGFSGDGQAATSATLNKPLALTLSSKALYIVDAGNGRIRRVDLTSNTITTVAGTGQGLYAGDGAPPDCSAIWPLAAAVDGSEDLFVPDASGRVFEISNILAAAATSLPETVGIVPANEGLTFSVDGGTPTATPQTPTWTLGTNHQLSASAAQTGQPDGYSYSFTAWSDGVATASRSVTPACPATYSALFSTAGCTFTISDSQVNYDNNANTGFFFLHAPAGGTCSWTAVSSASWVTITSPAAGTGSALIAFSVSAYTTGSGPRMGTITINGTLVFTITQFPVDYCNYSTALAPYSPPEIPSSGLTEGFFFLSLVGTNCSDYWTLSADQSWVQLPATASGFESATVAYSLASNSGAAARADYITVNAYPPSQMLQVPVNQVGSGLDLLVAPANVLTPSGGQAGVVNVFSMGAACDAWTAVSNVPWITITSPSSGSGSGFGTVAFTVDANTGVQRQGTMTIAGQTVTVTQNGGNCEFGLPGASGSATSAGGAGSFSLTANNAFCFWTATSNQPWLTLSPSSITGSGDSTIGYSTSTNSASNSRMGSISVGGQTFTVTQAPPTTQITVQTNPSGLQFSVDSGPAMLAPQTVALPPGPHTLAVVATQQGAGGLPAGTQYVFTNWSDGTNTAADTITVGSSPATYTANFQTQYQLTISTSPAAGGTVTPASGGYYNSGASVSVTATANSGFQFANWTGSVDSSSSAATSVTMSAPESVTANFTAFTSITIQTTPPGLQFTVDGGAPLTAPQTVPFAPGSQHNIAVAATQPGTAGTQYVFTSWSDGNTANPRAITVGAMAATYTATFQTQYQLTISASPAAGGSITPATGGYYNAGTSVAVAAAAASGYQFSNWTGGVANAANASTTVTMSAPETVVANFSSLTGITIQTSPPGLQFTVDGGAPQTAPLSLDLLPGPHTLAVATTQAIAGVAGAQYVFLSWSDAGAPSHTITVGTSAATYTATFQTQYQLTISASPAAGGTVSPATGTYYNSGTSVPLIATPASGYSFTGWTGSVASASSASTTVTMSAPETVIANFSSPSGVTIQTSPTGLQFTVDGGSAQIAPQTLMLAQGTHTIAVAPTQSGMAGTQYTFLSWSDGGAASHTITVGSTASTYTATFQTQYQLTISASPAADGTVSPASGVFYSAGTSVPIAATAASGFQFVNWTGAVASSTSASTTVTMSAAETVVANFTAMTTTSGLAFYPVTPCRVVDTRNGNGPFGGPIMSAGSTRSFAIPSSACGIPSTAQAYSLNITVVPPAALGYLTAWPAGQAQPYVSTLNSSNGAIIANAAIVPAGTGGSISIYVSDTTHVIIDINGYFGAPGGSAALAFYPVTPCRVADTRNPNGPFGGPSLAAGATRNFAVPQSSCGIPSGAQAYSLNMTVVPPGALEYLSTWPAGQSQPVVSTLNALQGQIAANAAIVPAGTNGAISVYVSDPSNVVIDINGYFAPPGGAGALYFYPVTPCRVADTRNASGTFGGPSLGAGTTRSFPIPSSSCGLPTAAQAYSFNMTVVPPGSLLYLSTWPAGQSQPVVSTLNDLQGQVVANAAIVPAGASGGISVFASDATNLIVDVNGYFGQ